MAPARYQLGEKLLGLLRGGRRSASQSCPLVIHLVPSFVRSLSERAQKTAPSLMGSAFCCVVWRSNSFPYIAPAARLRPSNRQTVLLPERVELLLFFLSLDSRSRAPLSSLCRHRDILQPRFFSNVRQVCHDLTLSFFLSVLSVPHNSFSLRSPNFSRCQVA